MSIYIQYSLIYIYIYIFKNISIYVDKRITDLNRKLDKSSSLVEPCLNGGDLSFS